MNHSKLHKQLMQSIHMGILKGINECEELNEGKLKNFLIGTAMAASVAGGMQSCSNMMPTSNAPTEQANGYKHDEYPDYSDRPWAFESYIGRTEQAIYFVVENKYRIRKLCIKLPTNADEYQDAGYEYYASWQDCDWAIFYKKTEKRDNYYVDIFYSYGAPLFDEPYNGVYYDGAAYFELWYTNEEDKTMNERAQFIRIYRSENEKQQTRWTVKLDNIKNTDRLVINNDGPNNGK